MSWPAGESAFVTGAASGIGLGITRALIDGGAKVALADIDGERLGEVARELTAAAAEVTTVVLDVSDPAGWAAAADQAEAAIGPISILCNNAGVSGGGTIEQTTLDIWRWVQKINIEGQYIGVATFLPRFRSRGGRAHILNTASMAALVPITGQGAYVASKFASMGFSLVLRDELAGSGIGVSVLCPGTVATRLGETAAAQEAKVRGAELDTATAQRHTAMLAAGADPDAVGRQVVEAMQAQQFLIITHREWALLVQRVHAEVDQTFSEFDGRYGVDTVAQALVASLPSATR